MRSGVFLAWAIRTLGTVATDPRERAMRFVEEAIELAQAEGLSLEEIVRISLRVFDRPPGETALEIGQVLCTLHALADNLDLDADHLASREYLRVSAIPKSEWAARHTAKVNIGIAK